MKPNIFKSFLSYFTEVHVETTSSLYNELLEVNLVKGRYQLCTKEAIYSYADKYDNFKLSFQDLRPEFFDFNNILLLGFGLGSVPYMLEKLFKKQCNYTGVEIDDEVVYLASKYVLGDLQSDIQMVTADALSFVALDKNKYDLVIMDVFESDVIPEAFEETFFLENIKQLLVDDGLFFYNRLAYTHKDRKLSKAFFEQSFLKSFPEGHLHEVKGNYMLCNKNVFK